MATYPLRSGVLVFLVLFAVVGCASRAETAGAGGGGVAERTITAPTESDSYINGSELADPSGPTDNCANGSAFKESLVADVTGYPTSLAAVNAFLASGQQPQYQTPAGAWTITIGSDTRSYSRDGVTLDVMSLPNGNWIVASGERCS